MKTQAIQTGPRLKILAFVLLVGGCAGRYSSPVPDGQHRFGFLPGGATVVVPVTSATLLGWIVPGQPTSALLAQFSPDGRALYVLATRGGRDQLAMASVARPAPDRLAVALRMTGDVPAPVGQDAMAYFVAAKVPLDPPVDPQHQPTVIDAATGTWVRVEAFIED